MQTFKQGTKRLLGHFGLFNTAQWLYQHTTPQGRMWGKKIREFERSMTSFYVQFIKPNDLCFDIGANFGFRTSAFLKLGARVIAVEPQDVAVENLKLRFSKDKRVTIIQTGAADTVGEREFFMGEQHVASSMSPVWIEKLKERPEYAHHEWSKKVKVPVTTLDELIKQYGMPAFIKIDVEGFENEVIKGLNQPVPALSLEYNREFPEPTIKAVERLDTLGNYVFNFSSGETMRLELPTWASKDELLKTLPPLTNTAVSGDVYARLRS